MLTASTAPFTRSTPAWPSVPLALITAGILMLALPSGMEGPILLPISPGHALSVLDTVALLPLLAGSTTLHLGLFFRRHDLATAVRASPGRAGTAAFLGGVGLGLLLASAISTFWWWWAVGAALFVAWNALAVVAVLRTTRPSTPQV